MSELSLGVTTVFITHGASLAALLSRRVLVVTAAVAASVALVACLPATPTAGDEGASVEAARSRTQWWVSLRPTPRRPIPLRTASSLP